MTWDGRAVANFVLDFCDSRGRAVTNLSLQKLVYFCHVWSLVELRRPLIKHGFQAWQYGPVLGYLYRDFRRFDDAPITSRATKINPTSGEKEVVTYDFDKETLALLTKVADFYSRLRATDLVDFSHAEGGPWYRSWNHEREINPGMKIEDRLILLYYSSAPAPFKVQ